MHVSAVWRVLRRFVARPPLLLGVVLALPLAGEALADPPWAAEHGYRTKHQSPETQQARRPDDEDDFVPASAIMFPRIDLGTCHREVLGSLVGGAGQRPAIAAGAVSGSLVGGSVGRSMDRLDQGCVGQVLEHAPTGRAVGWRNPDQGAAYRVTALRTYEIAAGQYCREFRTMATLAGRTQHVYGTACRQSDGGWRAVN